MDCTVHPKVDHVCGIKFTLLPANAISELQLHGSENNKFVETRKQETNDLVLFAENRKLNKSSRRLPYLVKFCFKKSNLIEDDATGVIKEVTKVVVSRFTNFSCFNYSDILSETVFSNMTRSAQSSVKYH